MRRALLLRIREVVKDLGRWEGWLEDRGVDLYMHAT